MSYVTAEIIIGNCRDFSTRAIYVSVLIQMSVLMKKSFITTCRFLFILYFG